ncbi:hypothetical protein PUN28_003980 [Cardiocondyla obscurior]|uniref:Uncharacterized protein n=1 Tax=Cardiocondyla obscurior TaxID=286306 RepID=A0AAW2GNY7_9HYME
MHFSCADRHGPSPGISTVDSFYSRESYCAFVVRTTDRLLTRYKGIYIPKIIKCKFLTEDEYDKNMSLLKSTFHITQECIIIAKRCTWQRNILSLFRLPFSVACVQIYT